MTTRFRYFTYLFVLHLLIGVLCYLLLKDQLYWLLPIEVLLVISLGIAYQFYRVFMIPRDLIDRGEAALSDADFTSKFSSSDSPEVDRLINLYNRMLDNLREERAGNEEKNFFLEKLLSTAQMGIILLDYDGKIASINDWAAEQFELGVSLVGHFPGDSKVAVVQQLAKLKTQQPIVLQLENNRRLRAEKGYFIDRGFKKGFIILQDITKNLMDAEKEAYGKVIRMMAHEVNNSIGATNSMLQSLLDEQQANSDNSPELVREYLPLIMERSENMNQFMHNFANVIRLPNPTLQEIDLTILVERMATLFKHRLSELGIELLLSKPEGSIPVKADAAQIEQVIINAITNAQESLDGQAGVLRIELHQYPAGFTVADNGPGIPPHLQKNIFTPFYSSKATGQGIGLTMSRDILQMHGAQYQLTTDPDGWTRFRVIFPVKTYV